ncbi:hypothetical protein F5888DRAFT_1696780 [Russula emetica]|nr:hypothetical protein F5888DRAFT_1696780 [Russula emetica]
MELSYSGSSSHRLTVVAARTVGAVTSLSLTAAPAWADTTARIGIHSCFLNPYIHLPMLFIDCPLVVSSFRFILSRTPLTWVCLFRS